MFEIIVSAIITILTSVIRWLAKKYGKEMAKAIVLLTAFVLSLLAAALQLKGVISPILVQDAFSIFAGAVAIYEVVWKHILFPAIEEAPTPFTAE